MVYHVYREGLGEVAHQQAVRKVEALGIACRDYPEYFLAIPSDQIFRILKHKNVEYGFLESAKMYNLLYLCGLFNQQIFLLCAFGKDLCTIYI